jgi:uncharacterized protein
LKEKINAVTFECFNEKYVYDVNKDKIVKISDDSYNQLNDNDLAAEFSYNEEINHLMDEGFLSNNYVERIIHPSTDFVEDILKNNIQKLCLQITQNCNFRCKYCVYSGEYETRKHDNKVMSWEIAKQSIDFLIEHSISATNLNIGFYGGEPLMNFDLIKKCMEYAESHITGKEIGYSMTTNGSLLTDEIVEELLKRNFKLTISIDGPKDIQDANRVMVNGNGTFDIVYNNIVRLCKKYPKLKENLSYSMVFDPKRGFENIEKFVFTEEDLFHNAPILGSIINENFKKENSLKTIWSEEFTEEWEYSKLKYMLFLVGKFSEKYNSKIMRDIFLELIKRMKKTRENYKALGKEDHPAGQCVPGEIRLFINADGIFYPCEKVSETSQIMQIGNLNTGFDFDKIKKLLNIGKLTEDECKKCYAFRHCNICIASADPGNSNGKLSRKHKLKACKRAKNGFEMDLKNIVALKKCGFELDNYHY